MSSWEEIFSKAAPEMLEGAIQMGEKLGGSGFQWKVSGYFLNWCLPWYMAALQNALGTDAIRTLIPTFIYEMQSAVKTRADGDLEFPVEDFLGLIDDIGKSYLEGIEEISGTGVAADRLVSGEKEDAHSIDSQIAEVAYNVVRVAYGVGNNQFKAEAAGEASTWILAMASSSFLRGLEIGMGEEKASRFRPGFFSRLRHELREQYIELPGYPLSHFLNIAGSIGKKWMQLSTEGEPNDTSE